MFIKINCHLNYPNPSKMKFLYLRFKDKELEKEYIKLYSGIADKFYLAIIGLLGIASLIVSVFNFHAKEVVNGVILILAGVILFVVLFFRKKCSKFIPALAFIGSQGILAGGFFYTFRSFKTLSPTSLFYQGFSYGLFTSLLQQFFPRFEIKVLFLIISIASRYLLVTPETAGGVVTNSLFDVASIFVMFCYEKNTRNLFQTFHGYRNELSKFKTLLAHHLPENIAIISKSIDKKFFLSNSFINTFRTESIGQLTTLASTLKINTTTLSQGMPSQTKSFLMDHSSTPTLLDFLNYCKNDPATSGQIVCFNVEGVDTEENKLSYEAKVFHLNWDGSEALTIMLNDLTIQETLIALKIADENKDRVLATVSHELRTPINGMIGVTDLIEEEFHDPKLLEYCRVAKVCSKMLLNLVNSILDLSQIRNNCIKLTPTLFSVQDMLQEIQLIFASQCSNKGLNFRIDVSENVPEAIFNDRSRLTQIIVNLLANALKFTFKGDISLHVTKVPSEEEIKFIVKDTGIGIKDEDRSKLFKMFGRLEQKDNKINTQGVGLGLTISNSLVKLLNPPEKHAQIEVESVFGEGTAFSFIISTQLTDIFNSDKEPTRDCHSPALRPEEAENISGCFSGSITEFGPDELHRSHHILQMTPRYPLKSSRRLIKAKSKKKFESLAYNLSSSLSNSEDKGLLTLRAIQYKEKVKEPADNKNVLVVDDNPINILIVSKILEKNGFSVLTALNGEDAVEKAKTQERKSFFKMILMDCQMPVMDGFQATQILNKMIQEGKIPYVPIFALTANDTKKDQLKCLEAGMSGYLSKPLKDYELKKIINEFVK